MKTRRSMHGDTAPCTERRLARGHGECSVQSDRCSRLRGGHADASVPRRMHNAPPQRSPRTPRGTARRTARHIKSSRTTVTAPLISHMDSEDRFGTAAKGVVRRTRNADHSDRSGRKTSLAVTFGQLAEYSNTGKTIDAQSRRYHIRQLTQRIQHDPLRLCNDFIRTPGDIVNPPKT